MKSTLTGQGVRNLNDVGKKSRPSRHENYAIICPHPEFHREEIEEDGKIVIAKTCIDCGYRLPGEETVCD